MHFPRRDAWLPRRSASVHANGPAAFPRARQRARDCLKAIALVHSDISYYSDYRGLCSVSQFRNEAQGECLWGRKVSARYGEKSTSRRSG